MGRSRKPEFCALCAGEACTEDHVPPQNLYPKPRRPNLQLHTVPACKSCNNGASTDDEELNMIVGVSVGDVQPNQNEVVDDREKNVFYEILLFQPAR